MASSLIHIAVTNELNKKLNKNKEKLFIGTIAPDISKLVGENKMRSHFLDQNDSIPNLEKFLDKYKKNLNDDFVLGYYIHLYTDFLWFKYFISEVYDKDIIKKLDGTEVKCNGRMASIYIYNDYTNLNAQLVDKYGLDFKIFYNELPELENIIEEIPMDKLHLIVDKTGTLLLNSKNYKDMIFNLEHVERFIELSVDLISTNLAELELF